MILADYNPTVLYLVTLPNLILTWAIHRRGQDDALNEAFSSEGELQLTPDLLAAFQQFLHEERVTLAFFSGAWSPDFVDLVYRSSIPADQPETTTTLVIAAETIYSPFALNSFAETLLAILQREHGDRPSGRALAVVAAKKLYFGVGGSLDDFCDKMRGVGAVVENVREEINGVRRGVVGCQLS
jgi:protein-histidine N-methyltransferase